MVHVYVHVHIGNHGFFFSCVLHSLQYNAACPHLHVHSLACSELMFLPLPVFRILHNTLVGPFKTPGASLM